MTRLKYFLLMDWAIFWMRVWTAWSFLGLPEKLDNTLFGWIVSQTGFAYMSWENYQEIEGE